MASRSGVLLLSLLSPLSRSYLLLMLLLLLHMVSARMGLALSISQLDGQGDPLTTFSTNAPIPRLSPIRSVTDIACVEPDSFVHERCFHFHNVLADSGQSQTIAVFEGWWAFDFSTYDPTFRISCPANCSIQQMSFGSEMVHLLLNAL